MSKIYDSHKVWLTIDIEEITDTNFNILWKNIPNIDYSKMLETWMQLCESLNVKSTCFVLGTFAKKYPDIIKKLYESGHEIASHGLSHKLVYEMSIEKWTEELRESKKILEEIVGNKITGYRSPSWSMPFQKDYYELLRNEGFKFSSSYFPFKTYLYGSNIDKKQPFLVADILEIPLAKYVIPFSGGFYLRALPLFAQKILSARLKKYGNKLSIYTHPYELIDASLFSYFKDYARINKDFVLAFYEFEKTKRKIVELVKNA